MNSNAKGGGGRHQRRHLLHAVTSILFAYIRVYDCAPSHIGLPVHTTDSIKSNETHQEIKSQIVVSAPGAVQLIALTSWLPRPFCTRRHEGSAYSLLS